MIATILVIAAIVYAWKFDWINKRKVKGKLREMWARFKDEGVL